MGAQDRPDATTRDRLIRSAARLLWERSYQATGVDDLCEDANARKGSFYHFFPSKLDLAIAAVEASWAETRSTVMEPVFRSEPSGLAQLRLLVERVDEVQREVQRTAGAYLGCPFGGLGQEMAHREERLRAAVKVTFDGHCEFMQGALERAVAKGEIPPGDLRRRARNLFAIFEGALLLAKVARDPAVFRAIVAPSILPLAADTEGDERTTRRPSEKAGPLPPRAGAGRRRGR